MTTMVLDWDAATVSVNVPVHHTATVDIQKFDIPLAVFARLLRGTDTLPLAVLPQEQVDAARNAAGQAKITQAAFTSSSPDVPAYHQD